MSSAPHLLSEITGLGRRALAAALAESFLLVARIEFFDLRQPADADATLISALQAAGEADSPLLGSAILAHAAFIPGWKGQHDGAVERMRTARTYARRDEASPAFLAWLNAVEAEIETRCGNAQQALRLIGHAEDLLAGRPGNVGPAWFDWFSATRPASFKGTPSCAPIICRKHTPRCWPFSKSCQPTPASTQCRARRSRRGRGDRQEARDSLFAGGGSARSVGTDWYAMGTDRIRDVRRALQPWAELDCAQRLDDRLYGWQTMLTALQR
ncbi:transcriptional regulator [Streptosporangiaceae bacterium NEAU-GS5]|nr:transcriptional regulator [Streptosporangiaceae bacterium NEAU-GS5]